MVLSIKTGFLVGSNNGATTKILIFAGKPGYARTTSWESPCRNSARSDHLSRRGSLKREAWSRWTPFSGLAGPGQLWRAVALAQVVAWIPRLNHSKEDTLGYLWCRNDADTMFWHNLVAAETQKELKNWNSSFSLKLVLQLARCRAPAETRHKVASNHPRPGSVAKNTPAGWPTGFFFGWMEEIHKFGKIKKVFVDWKSFY